MKQATRVVGSAEQLARLIGVSRAAIYAWMSGTRRISADYCPDIERATRGRVRCEDLRPDVDWSVLRGGARARRRVPAEQEATP